MNTTVEKMDRKKRTRKPKIGDQCGTKPSITNKRTTEKKPSCAVCGSTSHRLEAIRSMVGNNLGTNFFCPVATREKAGNDQLEPCPEQIAKHYQYDETSLPSVFKDMRERGYGRFVTSNVIDAIEVKTLIVCRENSDTSNPPKRRKTMSNEPDNQPSPVGI